MKIDRTEFVGTFQTSLNGWEKCIMGASIDDSEDPIQCYLKLREIAIAAHKLANPQLYKNGNEALVEEWTGSPFVNTMPQVIPTINRKYEEMEGIIKDCGTLEELAKHKEYCGKHPDLMPHYMNKLKELTGGVKI
jgi:hypothetical protein